VGLVDCGMLLPEAELMIGAVRMAREMQPTETNARGQRQVKGPACVEFSCSRTYRSPFRCVSCSPSVASVTTRLADLQPFGQCYKYGNLVHNTVAISFLLDIR
jgi:hypothetical protein